jgi:hypothetical protein
MASKQKRRPPAVAELVRRTRVEQGLPDGITDKSVLARVATVVEGAARRDAA